jgi:hypothetical protein
MALFGLIKSNQERALDDAFKKMFSVIFPNGEQDIERDCAKVNQLTHGKIPPSDLRNFVTRCKARIHIGRTVGGGDDDTILVDSISDRSNGRIDGADAYNVYVYLAGEAGYYDKLSLVMKKTGGSLAPGMQKQLQRMADVYAAGVYTDDIPTGYDEFGLTTTNPIPTVSVEGSNHYLSRLRFKGQAVTANRIGSTSSEVTPGLVDVYKLSVGSTDVGTIYICPYHRRNSRKPPAGFTLIDK